MSKEKELVFFDKAAEKRITGAVHRSERQARDHRLPRRRGIRRYSGLIMLAKAAANFGHVREDSSPASSYSAWELSTKVGKEKHGVIYNDVVLGVKNPIDQLIFDLYTDSSVWSIDWEHEELEQYENDLDIPPADAVDIKLSVVITPILDDFTLSTLTWNGLYVAGGKPTLGTPVQCWVMDMEGLVSCWSTGTDPLVDPPVTAHAHVSLGGDSGNTGLACDGVLAIKWQRFGSVMGAWNAYAGIYGFIIKLGQAGGGIWTRTSIPGSSRVFAIRQGIF